MGNSPSSSSRGTDNRQEDSSIHPEQETLGQTSDQSKSDSESSAIPTDGGSTAVGGGGGETAGLSPTQRKDSENESEEEAEEEKSQRRDEQLPQNESQSQDDAENEPAGENNDENDQEINLEVYTDPWDTIGWANEIELRKLEEVYSGSLSITYKPLPTRTISTVDRDHSMPVTADIELPDNTKNSYRALSTAKKQNILRPFLRRLRIAALSEGRNIEDMEVILMIAEEVGLDTEQLLDDMDSVTDQGQTTPRIEGLVGSEPHRWSGKIEAKRLQVRFLGEGFKPSSKSLSVSKLVDRHQPVATSELRGAYSKVPTSSNTLTQIELGGDEYWILAK